MSSRRQIERVRRRQILDTMRLIGWLARRARLQADRDGGIVEEREWFPAPHRAAPVPADRYRCRAVEDGERCPRRRTGAKYCAAHARPMRRAYQRRAYWSRPVERAIRRERIAARFARIAKLREALGMQWKPFRLALRDNGEAEMRKRAFAAALERAKKAD